VCGLSVSKCVVRVTKSQRCLCANCGFLSIAVVTVCIVVGQKGRHLLLKLLEKEFCCWLGIDDRLGRTANYIWPPEV
jgi:hypothetical protein